MRHSQNYFALLCVVFWCQVSSYLFRLKVLSHPIKLSGIRACSADTFGQISRIDKNKCGGHENIDRDVGIYDKDVHEHERSTHLTHEERRSFLWKIQTQTSLIVFGNFLFGPPARAESDKTDSLCENEAAIQSEIQIPGAYYQPCMLLPTRKIRLQSTGDILNIEQGASEKNDELAGRTGVAVWNSCLLLTRLIDAIGPSFWTNSVETVIELGCGTALAGITAAKLGCKRVIATDGNSEVVSLATRNAARNKGSNAEGTFDVNELKWGLLDASNYFGLADVIIGSDLTYNSATWTSLSQTMSTILKPGGFVLYVAAGHTGFNSQGEMAGFLAVAENVGIVELRTEPKQWPFGVAGKTMSPSQSATNYLLQNLLSKAEAQVLKGTGGAQVYVLGKKITRLRTKYNK